jgi:hypothetical protein
MNFDDAIKVAEILKWPAAFIVVALIALLALRGSIASLLSRARRAGFGDKSVEFIEVSAVAREQKRTIEANLPEASDVSATQEAPPPPPSEAVAAIEGPVYQTLKNSRATDQIKIAWLVRGFAQERLQRVHEQNYRLILGGQLALLLQVNTGAITRVSNTRDTYNLAKDRHPTVYENFSFENWLNWPKNAGLIEVVPDNASDPLVRISPIGRDFMLYLVATGLTGPKPG